MDLVVTGVAAGVLGTLVMDSLNFLFARTGMGACLWRRDDGGLLLLRFPVHGVRSVWQAVSRRH